MPIHEHQPVVLIAEEEDNDATMLLRAFQELRFLGSLQFVPAGEEVIAYLAGHGRFARRDEFPLPDFLLLNLKMPRMNGFEVLEWIHARPALAQLRTIVLTTSNDHREVDRAYQLGAASFLAKPVDLSEFKDTLDALTNYWLSINREATLARREPSPSVVALTEAIRSRYHVRTLHTESLVVSLLGPQHTSWHHCVEVFTLISYPQARKCFAWLGSDGQPVIVLASTQITSPESAVRSFYQ